MKTTNFIKIAIAGLSLAILSGCVNTRAIESSSVEFDAGYVANNTALESNVQIETKDFKNTSSFGLSGETIPSLSNEEAEKALTKILSSAGFYNQNGDYKLTASMVDPDNGGGFMNKREITINYNLVNMQTSQTLFNEDIEAEGKADIKPFLGIFGNAYEIGHSSGSNAYIKNFENLVNLLSLQ